MMALPVY